VGQPKVQSARAAILALNPAAQVACVEQRADAALLAALVPQADVVLDCTDNFATRHAINAACVQHRKPLVSGAAIRFDGQVSVFDARDAQSPCYACVFPPDHAFEEALCATMGVFAPLVGIIGSVQAAEALKLLAGITPTLAGRLQMLDAQRMEWTEMRLQRSASCAVCGAAHARG
jgi:molybdopterin/thiamine biosynthesis adenylyltransferase